MLLLSNFFGFREIKPSPNGKFEDCWWWTNSCNKQGYGQVRYEGKLVKIHRLAVHLNSLCRFKLDSKLEVCHICDNPKCFNPIHLFIGTHKENMDDAIEKGRLTRTTRGRFGVGDDTLLNAENRKLVLEMLDSKFSQAEIAKSFGVSRSVIQRIIREVKERGRQAAGSPADSYKVSVVGSIPTPPIRYIYAENSKLEISEKEYQRIVKIRGKNQY